MIDSTAITDPKQTLAATANFGSELAFATSAIAVFADARTGASEGETEVAIRNGNNPP